jgi:hypothetical protein
MDTSTQCGQQVFYFVLYASFQHTLKLHCFSIHPPFIFHSSSITEWKMNGKNMDFQWLYNELCVYLFKTN